MRKARSSSSSWKVLKVVRYRRCFLFSGPGASPPAAAAPDGRPPRPAATGSSAGARARPGGGAARSSPEGREAGSYRGERGAPGSAVPPAPPRLTVPPRGGAPAQDAVDEVGGEEVQGRWGGGGRALHSGGLAAGRAPAPCRAGFYWRGQRPAPRPGISISLARWRQGRGWDAPGPARRAGAGPGAASPRAGGRAESRPVGVAPPRGRAPTVGWNHPLAPAPGRR